MNDKYIDFINELAGISVNEKRVFNQYSYNLKENRIRRNNLLIYFRRMEILKPSILLVGEVPGYKGCKRSGVPFTSEYIMMCDCKDNNVFGSKYGYMVINDNMDNEKENTATIVWETLQINKFYPLLWNSFPFNPFEENKPDSNREPSKEELLVGLNFIRKIKKIFNIKNVIAIGNKAQKSINKMQIQCTKIRHPSRGGKSKFVEGIQKIC